jgi:acetyltransferase
MFCNVDAEHGAALVATLPNGEIAGVARLSNFDTGSAELALVVEDTYQRQGLGHRLLTELIALARSRGLRKLVAFVQRDNIRMLRLVDGCDLAQKRHATNAGITVTVLLDTTARVSDTAATRSK